jgi:hypothetical protein
MAGHETLDLGMVVRIHQGQLPPPAPGGAARFVTD